MKAYSGFKSEPKAQSYPMLPAGAYVATIKDVRIDGTEPDQQLLIRVEITEGEYAGYYTKRYNNDLNGGSDYEVKYKGVYRLRIPNPDNPHTQHPEWDVRAFNNAIWAIEQSNPGYHWDWNESGLKGRAVGINVREGTYNGNPYTSIGRLEVVSAVRDGRVKPMKPRPDAGFGASVTTGNAVPSAGFTPVEEDLPF